MIKHSLSNNCPFCSVVKTEHANNPLYLNGNFSLKNMKNMLRFLTNKSLTIYHDIEM